MKQIVFTRKVGATFAVLCCICWYCTAQVDTSLRAFFPLQQGDLWEYEVDDYPSYPRFQVRNLGDTTMPNGRVYFHLQGPEPGGYYRMDDSLRIFRYSPEHLSCSDSEFVVYDLRVTDRNIWPTCLPQLQQNWPPAHIGLFWSQPLVPYPRLGVAADTKMFCEAQIDSMLGDTTFCPLVQSIPYPPRRLAKGFGFVWTQYEGPATNLDGAIINGMRYGNVTSVRGSVDRPKPGHVRLEQSYPNPFNPLTIITFEIGEGGLVTLNVIDILGNHVATLVSEYKTAGKHEVRWNGTNQYGSAAGTGVYLCRLQTRGAILTTKLLLLR